MCVHICVFIYVCHIGVMTEEAKLECDNNVRNLPMFRNPDGSGIRRFDQVSKVTYLTTSRRLTLMFVWVHALGTGARMLPEPCRRPALVAIASMQVIILATQGRRAYSVDEWTRLLVDTSMEYFAALEFLMQYKEEHDTSEKPKTSKPQKRYVYVFIYVRSYMCVHICVFIYVCPYMCVHICAFIYVCSYMCAEVTDHTI